MVVCKRQLTKRSVVFSHAGPVDSCGSSTRSVLRRAPIREIEHSNALDELARLQPCAMRNRTAHVVEPGLPKLSHRRPGEFVILGIGRTGQASIDQMRDGEVALVF